MPRSRTVCTIDSAHRIARAGPSNVAKKPSPAVSISVPRYRARDPNDAVVVLHERAPRGVTAGGCDRGRLDDVGEEDRREVSVEFHFLPMERRDEALDLDRQFLAPVPQVVDAREFLEFRTRDASRQVSLVLDRGDEVPGPVDGSALGLDRGQDVP